MILQSALHAIGTILNQDRRVEGTVVGTVGRVASKWVVRRVDVGDLSVGTIGQVIDLRDPP